MGFNSGFKGLNNQTLSSVPNCVKVKGKGHPVTGLCRLRAEAEVNLQHFHNLGTRRVWLISTMPGPLQPRGKTRYA